MPIMSSAPQTDAEGNVYPYYGIYMAVSPLWQPNDILAPTAIRFVPYRIDEAGNVVKNEELTKNLSVLDAFAEAQSDPDMAAALGAIMGALQQYIVAKGI